MVKLGADCTPPFAVLIVDQVMIGPLGAQVLGKPQPVLLWRLVKMSVGEGKLSALTGLDRKSVV